MTREDFDYAMNCFYGAFKCKEQYYPERERVLYSFIETLGLEKEKFSEAIAYFILSTFETPTPLDILRRYFDTDGKLGPSYDSDNSGIPQELGNFLRMLNTNKEKPLNPMYILTQTNYVDRLDELLKNSKR